MTRLWKVTLVTACVLGVAMGAAVPARAQVITTGNILGEVADQQGGVLPGTTIVATHTETGTTYQAVARTDGRYTILNVRVGSYTIKATLSGFKDKEEKGVVVSLGEDKAVDFKLQLAAMTENVTVTADLPPIDVTRAGTAANISNDVKEALPTISRSLNDIARINPMFVGQGSGAGDQAQVISVAGTSFRYNTLQIDGANNNDLFGLAGSAGAPGGVTETQPVSLDAIREVQLVVSPYDVRQGGFSGGGINAVTKSGSNDFHGTAFFFGRNQNWVGKGVTDTKISTFKDKQGGFSFGGPIVKDKLFFFMTLDDQRKLRPTGVSVGGTGSNFGQDASVDRFLADLQNLYHYSPGPDPKSEFSRTTNSNKFFARADFNVATGHQLTVRHNYVEGLTDIGTPSTTAFRTPDAFYRFNSTTNSTVGQLNSTFGMGANELRVAYTRVRDRRGAQPFEQNPFPQVTVQLSGSTTIVSGREAFSTANELDQDIVELTDSYTMVKGNHTYTVGTHNEFFHFRNLFIRDNFGTYRFSSLDNFEAGLAQQFDYSYSATSDPKQAAKFGVNQFGFYAGDQWRARSNVSVTYGIRWDKPTFPDTPTANPAAVANFGYRTDITPSSSMWSPRVGVNWDRKGNATEQIRGGIGMFAGRPPYVWISNQYGNTGIDFIRIGAANNSGNKVPFVADANNQPKTVTGAVAGTSFTNEIDVIDPNFKYPSIWRGNIGYDRKLPYGLYATAEYVWSAVVNDIKYENLNYTPSGVTQNVDGRPIFKKVNTAYSDVILLTNTDQGHSWVMSFEVRRPFKNGFYVAGSYAYGKSYSIMDGTSDQAASNWNNVYIPGDPNNAPLTVSNFDPGHRINATATYNFHVYKGTSATASLFYSGQSGRPYTLTYSSSQDVNGDNKAGNDIMFLPTASTPLTYTNGTYQDLANFLNSEGCTAALIGTIMPRNACRSPWTNTLDGRVAFKVPTGKISTEITLDMLNLINLFSRTSGIFSYTSFQQISAFPALTSGGQMTGINLATINSPTFQHYFRDDLRSRWQLQLGARVRF